MPQPFIHLHNHTAEGSLLDGFGKVKLYAQRASEMGFSHLAITDHGNCDAAIKFQNACIENKIIPIFGTEAYIVENLTVKEKGDKRAHITLLAKNEEGFQNILKLNTIGHLDGFYYRPRIDPETLLKHLEGLIIMTGCSETFLDYAWGKELFYQLEGEIEDDLYIEIMPHNFEMQAEINKLCMEFYDTRDIKLAATNDIHYCYAEDAKAHEVLLAIQIKKKWNDPDRWRFTGSGYYMKGYREMVHGFKEQGVIPDGIYQEALRNTMEIAEKCSKFQKIEKKTISLPTVPEYIWETDEKILNKLCFDGFSDKIMGTGRDENLYRERMWKELDLIREKGFAKYFLIVYELINWCKQNDIMTGDRGSSAGSLVCYLLGITNSDPVQCAFLFERFISPGRCFVENTKIITKEGTKEIKDILPGDIIINKFGEFDKVLKNKKYKTDKKLIKIFIKDKIIECTLDHKWFIMDKDNRIIKKYAKDIVSGEDRLIEIER
jgi:DNA polymerase-3 subunit alpha